jgi:hypothetical protein
MTATIKYDDNHMEGDDNALNASVQASDVFQNAVKILNRQPNWILERMANSVTPEIIQDDAILQHIAESAGQILTARIEDGDQLDPSDDTL